MKINYEAEGIVFNIQRYSIHDGPGIRTNVFLKGCPLSCRWCSNPESQNLKPEIMFNPASCTNCGKCVSACSLGAISMDHPRRINREICTGCGKCQDSCLNGALEQKGRKMTVAQVVEELKKDSTYYRRSGGGITFTGGEPLVQSEFVTELAKACKELGWHTAIETTVFSTEEVLRKVFPYIDLALVDIKTTDDELHKEYTGVSNEVILKNAALAAEITKMVVRVPIIPDFNAGRLMIKNEIKHICDFAKTLKGVDTIHLLSYHNYGENKYQLLNRTYAMKETSFFTEEDLERMKKTVEKEGFTCIIGG